VVSLKMNPACQSLVKKMNGNECAIDETEAARILGMKVSTLRAWRLRNRGPRYVKFGRAVRYLPSELEHYVQANTIETSLGFCFGLTIDPESEVRV
jgi:predicted DNA-binding transcriptional regulator AlpA